MDGGNVNIQECVFTGGLHGVQIDESNHPGSVLIRKCIFDRIGVDALIAHKAKNLQFIGNECRDIEQDAIYFVESSGRFEGNRIYRSQNSGIFFLRKRSVIRMVSRR